MATPNRERNHNKVKDQRAKRKIKRRVKPGARGLVGSRGKAHCGA